MTRGPAGPSGRYGLLRGPERDRPGCCQGSPVLGDDVGRDLAAQLDRVPCWNAHARTACDSVRASARPGRGRERIARLGNHEHRPAEHTPFLDVVAEAPQLGDQEPVGPYPSGASIETGTPEVIPVEYRL
jgi:hypothetical protein